ncbi:uncharacterized protein LOC106640328 [Copidosoma floridanum]|uniref:uncharacterized protein LOC106640328 n=1 Tax=Copidosoma floridanum TaxID=29053 RepID=UPI0006C93C8B|nr:uncharacterized protein LOC106640328 [Copidosoma floridanum]
MDICIEEPHPREKAPSSIDIRNKIRLGHDECCNCCCCKVPQFNAYKYVQPEIPKPFRPIRCYKKLDVPLDDNTTYKMSFWPEQVPVRKPILPAGCLTVADGQFTDDTTHKMSYLGNWCVKPQEKILPCVRNWFGRGPIQDETTQKHDFAWKCGKPVKPIKYRGNLCLPRGYVADDTTYKLSYYPANCLEPIKSFRPIRRYEKSDVPLDGCTTYRLSFYSGDPITQENYPWKKKPVYQSPTTPVENGTTYKLSYWPQCAEPVAPVKHTSAENLLNRECCFEDNTTYNLSYFCGGGDRPLPIHPITNKIFDDAPPSRDTTHKMSYLGNWCPKPEKPILPCTRQLLGRGPIQDATTQKCDFTWKCGVPPPGIRPLGNLELSRAPLEVCTTNRLSFMPNCAECAIQSKNFAPVRRYEPADVPMSLDTEMKTSYGQPGAPEKVDKPWAAKPAYHKPTTHIDDSTTYGLSYIPPGTLEPCCPEELHYQCPSSPCSGTHNVTNYRD